MAAHTWELSENQPRNDRYRLYICTRCGKGPVQKDVFDDKEAITAAAKKIGISSDCNVEIVRKIMDE